MVACDAGDIAAWAEDDPGIRVATPTATETLAEALARTLTQAIAEAPAGPRRR